MGSLPGRSWGWGGPLRQTSGPGSGGLGSEGRSQHTPLTAEGGAAWRSPWGPCGPVSVPHTRVGDQGGGFCSGHVQARGRYCGRVWKEAPRWKAPSCSHCAPPSTPALGRKAAHCLLRPPLPSCPNPGGRRARERARKLCEPAGSPMWQAWGRPGPALWLRSDGWRLSASGGQCVRVDAASLCSVLRMLDSEGPCVASDLRGGPCVLPRSPSGMVSGCWVSGITRALSVIWLLGPALGPGASQWKLGGGGLGVWAASS